MSCTCDEAVKWFVSSRRSWTCDVTRELSGLPELKQSNESRDQLVYDVR